MCFLPLCHIRASLMPLSSDCLADQAVKLLAWEPHLLSQIAVTRAQEVTTVTAGWSSLGLCELSVCCRFQR